MEQPFYFTIAEIESALHNGPPYPVDQSLHLVYPTAGLVDSGNIKTTRDPLSLPDSMLLHICPEACSRHSTLGAVLRGCRDRLWLLKLSEADLVTGGYIVQVEQAAEEMIRGCHPKIIFICGTCIDMLLGSDYESLALKMEKKWGVRFGVAHMDPIMKDQRTPFKSRDVRAIHSVIRSEGQREKQPWVNLIGRPLPLAKESEMHSILANAGVERILHFSQAQTLEQLDQMGQSCLNIGIEQRAKLACVQMQRKHNIPYTLLESTLLPEKVHENYLKIGQALHTELDDSLAYHAAEQAAADLRPRLQGLKIAVGEKIQRRPFAAALELAKLGFPIDAVFTMSLQKEDLESVEQLRFICPECRVFFSGTPEVVAYCQSPEHFDMVLGLDRHYYQQDPDTMSVPVDIRYGDYYSIQSFLKKVKQALEKPKTEAELTSFFNKNRQQNQQDLRDRLRRDAEDRAREIAPNACLKRWGVYREDELI